MDHQRFGSAFKFVFISKLAMMRKLKAEVDFRGLIFFVLANVYLYDTFFSDICTFLLQKGARRRLPSPREKKYLRPPPRCDD